MTWRDFWFYLRIARAMAYVNFFGLYWMWHGYVVCTHEEYGQYAVVDVYLATPEMWRADRDATVAGQPVVYSRHLRHRRVVR